MKALLLSELRKLEVVDFPEPELDEDAVLVRVGACGICGSDVHGYDGSSGRRIPPIVMGHEAAGTVARVGAAVERVSDGDRVTFDSTVYCGQCDYCLSGKINLCSSRQVLGVSCADYRRHGAFAEYVVVPQHIVYHLPEKLDLEHAALIEPVSVAVHAVRRTPLTPDMTVAVIGTGMIGLLVIQSLRAEGVGRIIAVDRDAGRLALSSQLGADNTCLVQNGDPVQTIYDLTDGRGAGASFEVVGATPTFRAAVECVKKGGSVTLVGNVSPCVEAPLQSIVTRELTLFGSCASQGEYPRCIDLMASGAINVGPLISACVPLEQGGEWFERLYAREPGLMKVVLQP